MIRLMDTYKECFDKGAWAGFKAGCLIGGWFGIIIAGIIQIIFIE